MVRRNQPSMDESFALGEVGVLLLVSLYLHIYTYIYLHRFLHEWSLLT